MKTFKTLLACGASLGLVFAAHGALAQQRSFNVPREPAVRSIPEFARQAGIQIVAPADDLAGVTTPAIQGEQDAREALKALLVGTGLEVASDDGATIALKRKAPAKAAEADGGIDTVTVTATKRETVLMQTPLAVTAVSGDKLGRDGIRDVRQLGAMVPSMQVGFSPSDSGVQVTIRGITSNNFTELGDPTVGIHFDGMYSPRPQGGMALMHDVERIEVLRGPQGTLFGRNSTAGAINIMAKRPSFAGPSLSVEGELGNFNHRALRFVANKPLTDSLALRIAMSGEKTDSYIHQVQDKFDLNWAPYIAADGIPNTDQRWNHPVGKRDAYGAVDRWAGRASLLYSPNDKFNWLVTGEHYADQSPGGISLKDCAKAKGTAFACDHDQFYASINVPGILDMSIDSLRSEITVRPVAGIKVEYRTAVTRERRSQQYDGDGGAFASPSNPAYGLGQRTCCGGGDFGPLVNNPDAIIGLGFNPAAEALFPFEDLQLRTRWSRYDALVQELQIKSDTDGKLTWIAGLFDMREKNAIRFDVDIPWCCSAPRPLAQSFVQPDRQVKSTAIFGQTDYAVTERLNLTAGYRYTWDSKSDKGGHNHSTIGYWVNPGQFGGDFWYESWAFVGPGTWVPGWTGEYQSDVLTPSMGTSAADFLTRVPGTDNTFKASWQKGTWRLGFDYTVNDDLFVYGSVATGYKAGGFGDKVDTCDCGNITAFAYRPETNTNYELAFKARLADHKLNIIGTVYDSEYTDMQRSQWVIVGRSNNDTVNGRYIGTNLTTNVAAARIRGAELEGDLIPWEHGRINGWVSYTDSVITKQPGAEDAFMCFQRAYLGLTPCAPEVNGRRPTSFKGNKLPWAPEWSATINAEHSWILANGLRLSPYVSAHWQSKMFFNDNNFDEGPLNFGQKAFVTVNASMRLINDKDKWGAELYAYNLTDQIVRNWADPGPGYMKANFFAPRSYGVKFNYTF